MIDIHTHILPGIDDGAADWDETFAMAEAALAEGITALVATPHHANGSYYNPAERVTELADEANRRLAEAGIPLTVFTGQEIRVHSDLLDAWSRGELLPMAGSRYVLLELPASEIPRGMSELIHELAVIGLRPLIAHPERNAAIVRDPDKLTELVEAGASAQVTTHSLLGGFGKRIEQTAWNLCRQGLIHIVSSDAHHVQRRGFRLAESYIAVGERLGAQWADCYKRNAALLLEGKDLLDPPKETKDLHLGQIIARIFKFR